MKNILQYLRFILVFFVVFFCILSTKSFATYLTENPSTNTNTNTNPVSINWGYVFLAGIIMYLVASIILTRQKMTARAQKENYPRDSIIKIMNKKNSRDVYLAVALCFIFFVLLMRVPQLNIPEMHYIRYVIPSAVILLLSAKLALEHRIVKGWYGNNEREAREIIEFIIKESSNIDFKDGGELKKILNDEDLEEIRSLVWRPVPGTTD